MVLLRAAVRPAGSRPGLSDRALNSNASPPIFDAFGLGAARCNVATHFRFFTKRSRSSSLDLAPTQSCEPSHPSACRFETVGSSSGLRHKRPSGLPSYFINSISIGHRVPLAQCFRLSFISISRIAEGPPAAGC